ncbi:DUF4157 domain-containing protein [Streptacidiphilus sp. PB12-B1b]|uniref:eCIS core domain-containing protein n=1 Tax=Streptacidiphilus sp. PB12-B1b TaxID=2705012 RepID=UPI0015FCABAE|nr:DUF4157 domain-containing protein [Streptacidiphilus sp. PB12-B1b]QMU75793.1 DUF4157 domain-containing protein [Streptacidiphilus sp. PB12-B1b]
MQGSAGNAAVVQLLRQSGHPWAAEPHQHGAGCGHQEQAPVQRSAVHDVLRGGGQPLDDTTRTDMESRLGADFSDVRLHTGGAARASAAEIGARAYTSGSHVVIGDGGADKHTLAHELTHVIQQRQGAVAGTDNGGGLKISDPGDRFERAAEANATRVMAGPAPVQRAALRTAAAPHSAGELPVQRAKTPKARKRASTAGPLDRQVTAALISNDAARAVVSQLVSNHGWKMIGGARDLTLHKPQAADRELSAEEVRQPKTREVYGKSNNVIAARSYADERHKQAIRWISTIALQYLGAGEEVQGCFHQGAFYISSNKNNTNEELRALATSERTVGPFVQKMLEELPDSSRHARNVRHESKARERIVKEDKEFEFDFSAFRSAAVHVPAAVEAERDGFHAERRIDEHLRKQRGTGDSAPVVTPETTAGTKRPCVACYISLYSTTGARPGPYWSSAAANTDIPNFDKEPGKAAALATTINAAVTSAGGTYINACSTHRKAWDVDTDSDSDDPSSEASGPLANALEGMDVGAVDTGMMHIDG